MVGLRCHRKSKNPIPSTPILPCSTSLARNNSFATFFCTCGYWLIHSLITSSTSVLGCQTHTSESLREWLTIERYQYNPLARQHRDQGNWFVRLLLSSPTTQVARKARRWWPWWPGRGSSCGQAARASICIQLPRVSACLPNVDKTQSLFWRNEFGRSFVPFFTIPIMSHANPSQTPEQQIKIRHEFACFSLQMLELWTLLILFLFSSCNFDNFFSSL